MTLLEYVISNDEEIPIKKAQSEFYKQALEDFIMEGYCPSYFDVVKGTVYEAPLNPTRTDKKQCKNNLSQDGYLKCIKCWNRKVL